jgi:hypothetical protein
MERDLAAIAALKQTLAGIGLSLGSLPSPQLENLDEWKTKAPPIVQAAQAVALALQERDPAIAEMLDDVAGECGLMTEVIERDGDSPIADKRIAVREKRLSEHRDRVMQAAQNLK